MFHQRIYVAQELQVIVIFLGHCLKGLAFLTLILFILNILAWLGFLPLTTAIYPTHQKCNVPPPHPPFFVHPQYKQRKRIFQINPLSGEGGAHVQSLAFLLVTPACHRLFPLQTHENKQGRKRENFAPSGRA